MLELQSGVTRILVQAILTILGALVTYLTAVLVSYFSKKKELLIKQIGQKEYDNIYKIGKIIYYSLEQQFMNEANSGDKKKNIFDKAILEVFPKLTEKQINHIRESIVGEENLKIKSGKFKNTK